MSKEGVIRNHPEACPPATEVPNTSVFVSPENLERFTPLLLLTSEFIATNSQQTGDCFKKTFRRYQLSERSITDSGILPFIVARNMHLPSFKVFDHENGNRFLEERRTHELEAFEEQLERVTDVQTSGHPVPCYDPNFVDNLVIPETSMLVSYRYPKPISTFWHKNWLRLNEGETMSPEMQRTVKDVVSQTDSRDIRRRARVIQKKLHPSKIHTIEWGKFRMPLRHKLLDNMNTFTQGRGLEIARLNRKNGHSAGEYDYLFEVSLPQVA